MSKPVAIRKIIIEFNILNLGVLRDALANYHKYLQDCLEFENPIPLTKSAIKRRIRYIEDFLETLEFRND